MIRVALGGRNAEALLANVGGVLHDEVFSAAQLAIMEAVDTWSADSGASFSTWLHWRVRYRAAEALRAYSGVPRRLLAAGVEITSLDAMLEEERPGVHSPADTQMRRDDDRRMVGRVLADLSDRNLRIVCLHFFDGLMLKEIAKREGLTISSISRIIKNALGAPATKIGPPKRR